MLYVMPITEIEKINEGDYGITSIYYTVVTYPDFDLVIETTVRKKKKNRQQIFNFDELKKEKKCFSFSRWLRIAWRLETNEGGDMLGRRGDGSGSSGGRACLPRGSPEADSVS